MNKLISTIVCLTFLQLNINAQLKCKTLIDKNKNTVKKCFHKNGCIATLESWDSIHREGSFKVFNNKKTEIAFYYLRRFGGHASVYVQYYKNGQVSKIEYSSAPDGGIQFYRTITTFDEQGNKTSFADYSQPNGHPTLQLSIPNQ